MNVLTVTKRDFLMETAIWANFLFSLLLGRPSPVSDQHGNPRSLAFELALIQISKLIAQPNFAPDLWVSWCLLVIDLSTLPLWARCRDKHTLEPLVPWTGVWLLCVVNTAIRPCDWPRYHLCRFYTKVWISKSYLKHWDVSLVSTSCLARTRSRSVEHRYYGSLGEYSLTFSSKICQILCLKSLESLFVAGTIREAPVYCQGWL